MNVSFHRSAAAVLVSLLLLVASCLFVDALADRVMKENDKLKSKISEKMPAIHNTTWVISATTPLDLSQARNNNPLMKPPVTRLSSYVHWACHRQLPVNITAAKTARGESTDGTDKLNCCQHIYSVMQKQPELCWVKDGCHEKRTKTDFLRHCTSYVAHVPEEASAADDGSDPKEGSSKKNLPLLPWFSLVTAPEAINSKNMGPWQQFVSFDPDGTAGMHLGVTTPMILSYVPPLENAVDDDDKSQTKSLNTKKFSTKLKVEMTNENRKDENQRSMHYRMSWQHDDLKSSDSGYHGSAQIWTFAVEGAQTKPQLGSCRVLECGSSNAKCQVEWMNPEMIHSQEKAPILAMEVRVDLEKLPKTPLSSCDVYWSTDMHLEDDDFIIPGPALQKAELKTDSKHTWKWDGKVSYPRPISTDIDEIQRSVSWKSEL